MNYHLFKMVFLDPVHFGKGTLDSTSCSFSADTLFSGLCIEAVRKGQKVLDMFVEKVQNGRIQFSDGLPYVRNMLFLPKPYLHIEDKSEPGDSSMKKAYKNMQFLALPYFDKFLHGELTVEQTRLIDGLGRNALKVSVAIESQEEPQPYRVAYYHFQKDCGLYLVVGFRDQEDEQIFLELMDGLSFEGIGGKRSSGYGRFQYYPMTIPDLLKEMLGDDTATCYMTLCGALPVEEELSQVIERASYTLEKRSGFVASQAYAPEQIRKRDLYLFGAGSCFQQKFVGRVVDVSSRGSHPVYRYAMPMFVGIHL